MKIMGKKKNKECRIIEEKRERKRKRERESLAGEGSRFRSAIIYHIQTLSRVSVGDTQHDSKLEHSYR